MRYSVLTSGSCGNSYAFYDGKTTILIDVGLTLTGLKRRLVDADIPYSSIKALFLTHLHPDHVKGAGVFNRDSGINVHLTKSMRDGGTSILCKLGLKDNNLSTFDYGEKIVIDNFVITSFSTSHDSQGSCGYKIENGKDSFFLMTDTGIIPEAAEALAKEAELVTAEFVRSSNNYNSSLGGEQPINPGKKIYRFNFQGDLIETFNNANIAAEAVYRNVSNIHAAI